MKQDYFVYQVSYFKPLLLRLEDLGVDTEKIIQKSEINHFDLSNPQNYIPTTVVHDLFSSLTKDKRAHTAIVNCLHNLNILDFENYGSHIAESCNLNNALTAFCKFNHVLQTNIKTDLKTDNEQAIFSFSFLDHHSKGGKISEYILLSIVCEIFNLYVGHNWQPIAVHIPNTRFSDVYSILPNGEYAIKYDQSAYRFVFSKSLLNCNSQNIDSGTNTEIEFKKNDIIQVIKKVIASYKKGSIPSLKTLAYHFNTSESSMKRLLKSKQSKFSDILGQILQDRAVHFLMDSNMNINLISEELGYSDSPNFIRSFKKWTGTTPKIYRQKFSA